MDIIRIIAVATLIILLSCGVLDAWNVVPSMKKAFNVIEIPCFAFLVYYYFCRRSRTIEQKAFISQFWKYYRLPLRGVGWLFTIVGAMMLFFAGLFDWLGAWWIRLHI